MIPYYSENGITIYHADCREVLPDIQFDLLVTDPPYGINWRPRVNHTDGPWVDDETPDLRPFLTGKRHCIWGGNYFTDQLPVSESWLLWIKRPESFDFDADARDRTYAGSEMAWTDYGGKPRVRFQVWDGGMRAGDAQNRTFCHPSQKPIELMRWCIDLVPATDDGVVLDPYMGSGTTLRAALDCGRAAIGIEREERYCEVAVERLAQGSLFSV